MSTFQTDRAILRSLAARYAAIAALDVQEQNRKNWRSLYALSPTKPMFSIDQICWEELAKEVQSIKEKTDQSSFRLEKSTRWWSWECGGKLGN